MHVPADVLSAVVTLLAVIFIFYTGINVGRMRGKHKVAVPATTGPLEFECAYRVQTNTVEQAILFFPLLWVATVYFHTIGWLPALFGLVWVIGRFMYMQGYMAAPEKRSMGFLVGGVATLALLILSIIGIVQNWIALSA